MSKIKCGLIQMALKGDGNMQPAEIRNRMLDAHIPYIEDAGKQGVQVLCFQEVFTQPYFCPSQDRKWYAAAENIPDGPTTELMQEYAKKHSMVIVVPIYEEDLPGVYYNTAAVIDAVPIVLFVAFPRRLDLARTGHGPGLAPELFAGRATGDVETARQLAFQPIVKR